MVNDGAFNIVPFREDSEMIEGEIDENRPPPRLMISKMVCFVFGLSDLPEERMV